MINPIYLWALGLWSGFVAGILYAAYFGPWNILWIPPLIISSLIIVYWICTGKI